MTSCGIRDLKPSFFFFFLVLYRKKGLLNPEEFGVDLDPTQLLAQSNPCPAQIAYAVTEMPRRLTDVDIAIIPTKDSLQVPDPALI